MSALARALGPGPDGDENNECRFIREATLPAIVIGAIIGSGIGSAF